MIEHWGDRERWDRSMIEARDPVVGMLECPKPVIARINGHAMGLGASIAPGADITIAVEDSKIGYSHVLVGLATGDGGALLWPVLTGLTRARKFLLAGEPSSGKQAAEYELITRAPPPPATGLTRLCNTGSTPSSRSRARNRLVGIAQPPRSGEGDPGEARAELHRRMGRTGRIDD